MSHLQQKNSKTTQHLSFTSIAQSQSKEIVRVLVIEDDADDRELLVRQLRKSGTDAHVKFISDGREALEFLSHLPPASASPYCDLMAIFLDLRLPAMSGLDILRRIRKMPHLGHVPVVIMTASLDPRDFEECERLRVASYVTKPVTIESFAKVVTGLAHLPG